MAARQIKTGNTLVEPDLLAELHALEATLGAQSLLDFIPRASPVMPGGVKGQAPTHLHQIAKAFAQAEYGPVRIAISVPPRHGKTELILHLIAWWLHRHPEQTIAYCSYSGDFAKGKSARARDIAINTGVPVRADRGGASQWHTMQGGGVLASGIGGALTGHGANLAIIDDPHKNRAESESPTMREQVWEWFTSTFMSRLTPQGSAIVVHTRWHPDDLIGRIAKRQDAAKLGGISWQIFNLPAIDDSGHTLWPGGGWTQAVLADRREEVGEYDWSALYLGDPRPRGGRLFEHATYWDTPVVGGAKVIIACDPAATAKTHADYSAIVVGSCWLDDQGQVCIDVLEVWRKQVEIPMLVAQLVDTRRRWADKDPQTGRLLGVPIAVEAVAGFKAVPQGIRMIDKQVKLIEINPGTDKFTRALPVSAAWNRLGPGGAPKGRIRVPRDAARYPWVKPYLREMQEFTGVGDVQDDQVDATAHLYRAAYDLLRPTKQLGKSEIARYFSFG